MECGSIGSLRDTKKSQVRVENGMLPLIYGNHARFRTEHSFSGNELNRSYDLKICDPRN